VTIPKGVDTGVNLRMSKKGNYALKGESGDLLIKLSVRKHPYFKREGFDIHTDKYVTMTQAILGSNVKVETLQGKIDMKLKPGTVHDE
jgi:molecular chaperone DnaJ